MDVRTWTVHEAACHGGRCEKSWRRIRRVKDVLASGAWRGDHEDGEAEVVGREDQGFQRARQALQERPGGVEGSYSSPRWGHHRHGGPCDSGPKESKGRASPPAPWTFFKSLLQNRFGFSWPRGSLGAM